MVTFIPACVCMCVCVLHTCISHLNNGRRPSVTPMDKSDETAVMYRLENGTSVCLNNSHFEIYIAGGRLR